jgi:hypothetical protein
MTNPPKKVQDACTLVDQLGMVGISEEEFIKTYTARKYVKNLRMVHPRFWFETWLDLNLVTINGRDTNCMPGAPNNKDLIIKMKNASRIARLLVSLARHSTSASKPTKNLSGPSFHYSTNDPSKHAFLQLNDLPESNFLQLNDLTKSPPPSPKKNISAPIIVPLREHLARCFKKQLGIEAIASIVEDLILFNSDL